MLILTATMGAGHMQASRELERRFADLGWETAVQDVLEFTPHFGRWLTKAFPWTINHAPWIYEFVYRTFMLSEQKEAERASVPVLLALPGLRRLVAEFRPDLVVSTYHLAGVAAARLRASGDLDAPAVTLVTQFAVHDLWIHPGTDLYLCITPSAASQLQGRTSAPVEVCEPVVRSDFRGAGQAVRMAPPGHSRPRRALVAAGSLGIGSVAETVRALGGLPGWQPVVVCGRNDRLRATLAGTAGTGGAGAEVHGWVDDMVSLLRGVDVLVDNAGGSMAKEALAIGCPVVTFRPIAGHGRHDAQIMQDAGVGEVVDDVAALRCALERLESPAFRRDRVAKGRALFGRDPARLLVEWIDSRHGQMAMPRLTGPAVVAGDDETVAAGTPA